MSLLMQNKEQRITGYAALHSVAHRRSAISPEVQDVFRAAYSVVGSQERSFALFGARQAAMSDLWALVDEEPVSREAALQAESFIRALPEGFPPPELAAYPDGSVSLDWIQSRNRMFTLSIGEGPRLPYAWVDGSDSGYAVALFDGETVPERILEDIRLTLRNGNPPLRPR